jgi:hypothetical protein
MGIVAVLDWEWSPVVPRQSFIPPLWLGMPDATKMAYNFYEDHLKHFGRFLSIVRCREHDRFGRELLADEWERAKADAGSLSPMLSSGSRYFSYTGCSASPFC